MPKMPKGRSWIRENTLTPSEDSDSDSEPKRPKPAKTPRKVQTPVLGFLSAVHSSADKGQSSASSTTFNVDTVVEVEKTNGYFQDS